MKTVITILIFALLTVFQGRQELTINNFANTQYDFELIQSFKSETFVNSIINPKLYDRKLEVTIKAKKSHSNKSSYEKKVYTRIQI